jgi:signal transduction histidine kinase
MNNSLSRNLFLTLFLVGLANIFLAYWFFYSSSVSLLKERGAEQMVSVRTLASQKLSLYLDVLKTHVQGPEVIAIYEEAVSGNYRVLAGNDKFLNPKMFWSMKANQLYPAGTDELMMKVEKENKKRVLIFAGVKLSELIGPEEGLGKSGEIYIVGPNDRIRSTSRHIQNRKPIIVKNDSVKFGRAGKTGVHEIKDYRGVEVLSAYSPFHYDHLNFVILGEIDKEEVLQPLENLFPRILLICGFLCCLTLGLAIFSTREIMRLIDDMREKINKFHIRLINTMEEEKKRMSYNLHDGVGQILTAIKWGVAQEESPIKLKELCDDAFKEIRSVSDNLMPAVLTEFGFFSAIREYLAKQEGFYKIQTTYRYSDQLGKVSFREGMDVNLYRLIQELIHNTIKHSKARSISLVLLRENENFFLRYEDDGIGMPDADPMPKVILYRSELMGAIFKRTKLAEGLVYEISVPLKRLFHEL